ncbi:hypothetical protein V7793_06165 [Streptomyces sp. KLMMK]|uniref:hypothetical protein n=1 Tax=Streptomyces sp. KLMMK TaxID=3109353 RepID=UPI002FFE6B05
MPVRESDPLVRGVQIAAGDLLRINCGDDTPTARITQMEEDDSSAPVRRRARPARR